MKWQIKILDKIVIVNLNNFSNRYIVKFYHVAIYCFMCVFLSVFEYFYYDYFIPKVLSILFFIWDCGKKIFFIENY